MSDGVKAPERMYMHVTDSSRGDDYYIVWRNHRSDDPHAVQITEYVRADLYDKAIAERDEAIKGRDYLQGKITEMAILTADLIAREGK